MILETAVLDVVNGQERAFEAAAKTASPILSRQKGHLAHRFKKCVERPGRYLLLVWWESLDDHVNGFRNSSDYEEWRQLLHHFYDPFPSVEHFDSLFGANPIPEKDGDE